MAEVRAELPLNFHLVKLQDNICQAKSPSFFSPNIYLGGHHLNLRRHLKILFALVGLMVLVGFMVLVALVGHKWLGLVYTFLHI